MAEYINKQQILDKAKALQNNPFCITLIIAEIEKADAVDLVMCKECEYGINHQNQKTTLCTLKEPYEVKWENAFCSCGERSDT